MYKFKIINELILQAEGQGIFFAKKGSMIADIGQFKYSKRLLGTNQGSVVGQVINHFARKITGENLELMEVNGCGICYLADNQSHITVIELENVGAWNSICVESEDLLAFNENCHYGVTPIGVGVISQRGFFTSKLTYNGQNAQVAIKTKGNPLVLTVQNHPVRVDPDAIIAWTGKSPNVKIDFNFKTLMGQTSGETYMFEFSDPGQIILIQPFERDSGLKLGIDDDRYRPQMQNNPFSDSRNEISDVINSARDGGFMGAIGRIIS